MITAYTLGLVLVVLGVLTLTAGVAVLWGPGPAAVVLGTCLAAAGIDVLRGST